MHRPDRTTRCYSNHPRMTLEHLQQVLPARQPRIVACREPCTEEAFILFISASKSERTKNGVIGKLLVRGSPRLGDLPKTGLFRQSKIRCKRTVIKPVHASG